MVKLFEALLHPYRVPGVGKVLRQLDPLSAKLDKTVSDSLDYDYRQGKDKFSGLKRGGKVKKFAKGGSMDDNEVRSNLPEKNAVEQKWEARKKSSPVARKPDPKMVKDAADRGAIRKYAKGGSVRGDGCCVKGKTKGRHC